MGTRDPRVDAYIEKSQEFARPILAQLRATIHVACPGVEEAMKWSFPHFMYKGMLCSMAAFKQHCAFGFWKGSLVLDGARDADAMGQFGRITKASELPPKKVLIGYIKKAAALNDDGVKVAKKTKRPAPALRIPPTLTAALKKNKTAQAAFTGFSPSHKREYSEWIAEAKSDDTRARRLQTAIEWIAEGKTRHWKYLRT
jgi:uncharacterized protein YdeI (YjbR/CyaY-like superfamily)